MDKDIDRIIESVRGACPAIKVAQLRLKFAADDDGIWFFNQPNCRFKVQLESPQGMCPFLIETNEHAERFVAITPEAASEKLLQWLHISPCDSHLS